ncbi:MAG: hypothetical protein IJ859_03125 [Synergistaceae bacterium]|nr:hypothetical protein [Synergistaceae bacterium]
MSYSESFETIIDKEHKELTEQEKNDYAQVCKESILKHISDNTGDSLGVEICEINVYAENIVPQIEYSFAKASEISVVPDRLFPSNQNILVTEKSEILSGIEHQAQNDLNNLELIEGIGSMLSNRIYGEICDTTEVYENPVKMLLHSQCQECNGMGKNQCSTCNGYGTYPCPKCNGHGQVQCERCRGNNSRHYYSYGNPQHHLYNTPQDICPTCNGAGYHLCKRCKGRGYEVCFKCGGSGQLKCEQCCGTGWLTLIGRTFIKTTPNYLINYLEAVPHFFDMAIKKIGANNIGHYASLQRYDSYRTGNGVVIVRYTGRLTVAEAEVKIKGKTSKWILAGNNASVIDAGGAIDNVVGEQISSLSNCRVSLLTPWGDARKKISNFMSYDINHKIIEASIDNDDPQIIRNLLNNSVSEQYISESMEALIGVFKRVRSINSWLFTILFAILPCAIAYFILPVYINGFIGALPFLIVLIAIPSLSAVLIPCFLNNWYNSRDKNLLRVWSKKRSKNLNLFIEMITLTPGIATYLWFLLKIFIS